MKSTNLFLCAFGAVLICSCGTNRYPSPTGFLSDYSRLEPNDSVYADFAYFDPEVDWSQYRYLVIDPVILIGDSAAAMTEEERNMLGTTMRQSFIDSMSKEIKIVDKPGPKVARLRLALSDLEATSRTLNTLTTVLPPARLISEGQNLASGTQSFAGAASLEAELVDSVTGKQLGAGIDRQFGRKRIPTAASKWGEVDKIFDRWASEMTKTLKARITSGS